MPPLLLLVTGLPGTGKTTLGKRLALDLSLPFVHKDGIKELLFETLGWSDRVWSRRLGVASSELLYYFAETQLAARRSCIVESNFDPQWATPKFNALQAQYGFTPLQLLCQTDAAVRLRRFVSRAESGERHPGHLEHTQYMEQAALSTLEPLGIGGQVIIVDTTDDERLSYATLLNSIQRALLESEI